MINQSPLLPTDKLLVFNTCLFTITLTPLVAFPELSFQALFSQGYKLGLAATTVSLILLLLSLMSRRSRLVSRPGLLGLISLFQVSAILANLWKIPDRFALPVFLGELLTDRGLRMAVLVLLAVSCLVLRLASRSVLVEQFHARFVQDCLPGMSCALSVEQREGRLDERQAAARRQELLQTTRDFENLASSARLLRETIHLCLLLIVVSSAIIWWTDQGDWETYVMHLVGQSVLLTLGLLACSTAVGLCSADLCQATNISGPTEQLPRRREVVQVCTGLMVEAVTLGGLGLPPGASVGLHFLLRSGPQSVEAAERRGEVVRLEVDPKSGKEEEPEDLLLRLGKGLREPGIRLAETPILSQLSGMRRALTREWGFAPPRIHVRDDLRESDFGFELSWRGFCLARGTLYPDRTLAVGASSHRFGGLPGCCPRTGGEAVWIVRERLMVAAGEGCRVLHPAGALGEYVEMALREHAHLMLSRDQIRDLTNVRSEDVDLVHRVVCLLLEERVSFCELDAVVDLIQEGRQVTGQPEKLADLVRVGLGHLVCREFQDPDGGLNVLSVECDGSPGPQALSELQLDLERSIQVLKPLDLRFVVLAPLELRRTVRHLLKSSAPQQAVLCVEELPENVKLHYLECHRIKE